MFTNKRNQWGVGGAYAALRPAHQIALQEMVEAVRTDKERVGRLETAIAEFVPNWTLASVVRALQAEVGMPVGLRALAS